MQLTECVYGPYVVTECGVDFDEDDTTGDLQRIALRMVHVCDEPPPIVYFIDKIMITARVGYGGCPDLDIEDISEFIKRKSADYLDTDSCLCCEDELPEDRKDILCESCREEIPGV